MCEEQEDVFYYLTVMNENYVQPALPEGSEEGILRGMYLLREGRATAPRVQLLGSGTILREVIAGAELLESDFGVARDVWSVTSFTELRRDGLEVERWNRLHPTRGAAESYVAEALSGRGGPFVAATDYMRAFADQIRPFVPGRYAVLGTGRLRAQRLPRQAAAVLRGRPPPRRRDGAEGARRRGRRRAGGRPGRDRALRHRRRRRRALEALKRPSGSVGSNRVGRGRCAARCGRRGACASLDPWSGEQALRRRSVTGWSRLPVGPELWERLFMVSPLVLVGTKEGDGWDFAPKHMAMPLGWEGFYCFVCTPRHATYRNIEAHPQFTVSFPRPDQVLESSYAAGGRFGDRCEADAGRRSVVPARVIDGRVLDGLCARARMRARPDHRRVRAEQPRRRAGGRSAVDAATRCAAPRWTTPISCIGSGCSPTSPPGRFAVVRDSLSFPFPERLPAVARWPRPPSRPLLAWLEGAPAGDGRTARAARTGRIAVARAGDPGGAVPDPRCGARARRLHRAGGARQRRRRPSLRTARRGDPRLRRASF